MGKALNLDLLEFHVREAAQELDLLLDAIQYAKGGVHGTDGSRRCRKRTRSSTGTRSSRVRMISVVGSRSSGRSRCYMGVKCEKECLDKTTYGNLLDGRLPM